MDHEPLEETITSKKTTATKGAMLIATPGRTTLRNFTDYSAVAVAGSTAGAASGVAATFE